jgi:hypothetical protein
LLGATATTAHTFEAAERHRSTTANLAEIGAVRSFPHVAFAFFSFFLLLAPTYTGVEASSLALTCPSSPVDGNC